MSPPDGGAPLPPLIAIIGPTASGKTRFALEVAERLGAEILSCDSMAVYRGLDIGTDKPTAEDRARVPHHLLDLAEPGTASSAGAFRSAALTVLEDLRRRGRCAVLAGGTGLYYRALTQGLADLPPRDEALRARLAARLSRRGSGRLHEILCRLDPPSAKRIMPADALRIVRALEIRLLTGRPMSSWVECTPFGPDALGTPLLRIGLIVPREVLYGRIEARVDDMMARGLLSEVEALHSGGQLVGPVRKAIGYGEIADYLEGSGSLDEAVARIKRRTRHLAKRQMTWFRKEPHVRWYTVDAKEAWKNDAIQFIQRWRQEAWPAT